MIVKDKEFTVYLKDQEIQTRINELAKVIEREYVGRDPLFLVVLSGAFIFASDLVRRIGFHTKISFIKLSSYKEMKSSGKVKEIIGLQDNINDREIVIIEDIVDTGATLEFLLQELRQKKAKSVEVATMFLKPDVFADRFPIRYIGFRIPNKFVIGYGLDYEGYGRNLNDLYQVRS